MDTDTMTVGELIEWLKRYNPSLRVFSFADETCAPQPIVRVGEIEEIEPIQAMMDALGEQMQKKRSRSEQMTLGELIYFLRKVPKATVVRGLGALFSYRGYYCDLAFEPTNDEKTIRQLLDECEAAMGRVFIGYKGGEFLMGETTPLWVSAYGSATEQRLMGFETKNKILVPVTELEA